VSSYTNWDKRPRLYARKYASVLNCSLANVEEEPEPDEPSRKWTWIGTKVKRMLGQLPSSNESSSKTLAEDEALLKCLREIPVLTLAEKMPIFFHYPWTGPNVWKPHKDGHYATDPVLPGEVKECSTMCEYSSCTI